MKKASIVGIFLLIMACQSNDPVPTYNSIFGRWRIENSDVVVEFDVIYRKNSTTDTIFTTNSSVTYLGKTAYSASGSISKVQYQNGFYSFTFQNDIGPCPVCAGNITNLTSFHPNKNFTEMTSQETDQNGTNYPYDGSWVSVVGFDGTMSNKIVFFKNPIVLKKINGQN